jgi:post-segregation antitoxin (ccd killing protein)
VAKEKVTLTLDTESLAELRALVGAKSLSKTVDAAITAELARRRHLTAVDEWLGELDRKHGAVPAAARDWAARVVDAWSGHRSRRRRVG